MPVYTYLCKDCGEKTDLLIGVTSEKVELKCKKCGSKNIHKTLNIFSIIKSNNKKSSFGSGCPTGTCPTGF